MMQQENQVDIILSRHENQDGIEIYFSDNDKNRIPIPQCTDNLKSYECKAQWLLLKELIDNGEAEQKDNFIIIPNESLFNLPYDDLRLLNLPEAYPYNIKIESRGKTLNQSEFEYIVSYCEDDGTLIFSKRTGCILRVSDQRNYFLTKEQVALLNAIESFNNEPGTRKQFESNLLKFSEIKELANETGAMLDGYLNKENVVNPKRIRLKLNRVGNVIEITPELESFDNLDNLKFEEKFELYPHVQGNYTIQHPDNSRTRIVFNDEQKEALTEVKKKRRVNKKEAENIAACPQAYFDPEIIELDVAFSGRVKEVGFYRPRVYPFIFPYKSKWFPGVVIKEPDGEQKRVDIKSEDDFRKIDQLIEKAREEGKETITWNDTEIAINDISKHIPFFREQISKPERPSEKKLSNEEPVLIIEENIEDAGYKEKAPKDEKFLHRYECPPNLISEIEIYPHQQEGLAWLQELYRKGHAGGLLADDMGLGKTLQVLSFIDWHNEYRNNKGESQKPYLIIAPLTLLENWEAEYNKFFYHKLKIVTLYGDNLKNYKIGVRETPFPNIAGAELIREKRGSLDAEKLKSAEIVLTTYETARDFQLALGPIYWAVIVIDEAQKIKTPGNLVTNAIKALKTDFRIACTGTPVENSLVDLWCITDFVVPGYLGGAKEFAKKYNNPLGDQNTSIKEVGEKVRSRIGIYIKRRLKKDILTELPEKHPYLEQYPMPEMQSQRYIEELNALQENNLLENKPQKNCILQSINALRSISDHPFLITFNDETNIDEFINKSAKLIKTIDILEGIQRKGEKVIIFSERKNTCRMLKQVVCNKFRLNSNDIYIVNGDMPGNKQRENNMRVSRQTAINLFEAKRGFNIIIMSPLAAGLGLNVTGANHVIHYSRWWNPAKEDQATDRVYRIGQKLPVHVYYPMATSPDFKSFDIILHELLERKRLLMSDTLFPTEQAEVTPDEVFEEIFKDIPDSGNTKRKPITIEEICSIDPFTFEAVVASIFQSMGKNALLTPEQNDKGVDVIIMPDKQDETGMLIQVKQTSEERRVGPEAVKEVFTAKRLFERRFNIKFECSAVTNTDFTSDAKELAAANDVMLRNNVWLERELTGNKIYWATVRKLLLQRMDRV